MDTPNWADHLASWRTFLERSMALADDADDNGEVTRLRRQLQTIERVRYGAAASPSLLTAFIRQTCSGEEQHCGEPFYFPLNDSQRRGVGFSLGEAPLTLIQGPPGTGKTQVIAEICLDMLCGDPDARILVCSETHVAVNNLVNRIADHAGQYRILRIRDKEGDAGADAFSPRSIVSDYFSRLVRVCPDEAAVGVIGEELGDPNNPSLEKALALSSNVVGMTCNRTAAYDFKGASEMFDTVIIDEACKATLPEILAPLLVARRAVIVGDPMQLPPVFCSEDREIIDSIEDCNLQNYMYVDELFRRADGVVTLDTQYRMVDEIGTMISTVFYDGALKNGRVESKSGCIVWVDYTPTQDWPPVEDIRSDRTQIYNLDECEIIYNILDDVVAEATPDSEIAVISPYRAQVALLRKRIRRDYVTIDTVDAFQGKECDIVIFSMTRTSGSFRFIEDRRRLNVALSRARDKIVIVGNLAYCSKSSLLSTIAGFCKVQKVAP